MADIEAESRDRNVSKSNVVRERLESGRRKSGRNASFDDIADLIGSVDGLPPDLSTRKKGYLGSTGYGQRRSR